MKDIGNHGSSSLGIDLFSSASEKPSQWPTLNFHKVVKPIAQIETLENK